MSLSSAEFPITRDYMYSVELSKNFTTLLLREQRLLLRRLEM